eukprot:m.309703 g.309703  ORF g.309703 m.309703 type:complete len:173 (+) comp16371_c1_seq16:4418-4936(+)
MHSKPPIQGLTISLPSFSNSSLSTRAFRIEFVSLDVQFLINFFGSFRVVPAGKLMLFLGALLCTAALTASPLDSAGRLRADSRNEPPRGQSGRELSASKRQLQRLEVLRTTRQFGVGDDTPLGPEVDCRVRRLAAEYAGVTQRDAGASWARRPDLLHDALELSARCNDTRPP